MPKVSTPRSAGAAGRTAPSVAPQASKRHDDEAVIDIKLRRLRGESISEVSKTTGMSVSSVRRFLGLVRPDPRQSQTAHEELQTKLHRLHAIAEERFAAESLGVAAVTPVAVVRLPPRPSTGIAEVNAVAPTSRKHSFTLIIPVKRRAISHKPAPRPRSARPKLKAAIVESESEAESESEESDYEELEIKDEPDEVMEEGGDVEMESESKEEEEGDAAGAASIRDEIHLGNLLVISYTSDRVVAPDGQLRQTRTGPSLLPAYEDLIEARQDNSISIRARGPSYRNFRQAVLDFRGVVQKRDDLPSLPTVAELSSADRIRILASTLLFRLYHFKASSELIKVWNSPEEYETAVEAALKSNESLIDDFNKRYEEWAERWGVKTGEGIDSEGFLSLSGEARKRAERLSGQMRTKGCSTEEEAAIKGMARFVDISVGSAYGSGDNVRWWGALNLLGQGEKDR